MHTFSYKGHYIHENFTENVIRIQINYKVYTVKSVYAAKIAITKFNNKGKLP